ncbi:MAG: YbjN domain-containing protein [Acidimicrobiales bacterium]|nr:YbjN domain-containing protein [Acidimicrobiales bacterium]
MQSPPATAEELADLEARIDAWLAAEMAENPALEAVERSPDDIVRWFVRVRGEEKDVWTAWWTLGQRTLGFETFLMPAPEENEAAFYEHLLIRNRKLTGLHLEIGEEHAVFLRGSLPVAAVTDAELDRILGSMWAAVELIFKPALRIGFASRFDG